MRFVVRVLAGALGIALLGSCGGSSSGPSLNLTADSPPAGVTGTPYAGYSFAASGGTAPLRWSESGPLPPGLALSNSGQLSGTPTVAGTYSVAMTVTDSSMPPLTTSALVTLKVSDSTITLAPASPPAGLVSFAYPGFTFSANGGSPPYTWAATGNLPPGLSLGTDGTLSGTPTQAGSFSFSITPTDSAQTPERGPALPVRLMINTAPPPGSFTILAALLTIPRTGHTATLLASGKVLIAGGGNGIADSSAELYDPVAGTFTATAGPMIMPRIGHTATLLSNPALAMYGEVLIVGSIVTDTSAELYNPASGKFTATGSMQHPRNGPTATLLGNPALSDYGKVLIVGGNSITGDLSAELYDPATQTFSDTLGSPSVVRSGHTATLLLDGRVLVAGGNEPNTGPTASAEIYDPHTGMFTPTGSMTVARVGATATLLEDGTVLVLGSAGPADLFDPQTGTFAAVAVLVPGYPRATYQHTASLRSDGTVLVTGGYTYGIGYRFAVQFPWRTCSRTFFAHASSTSSALFATDTGSFTPAGSLNVGRDGHAATLLMDGTVLVTGGTEHFPGTPNCNTVESQKILSSAELFK